MLSGLGDCYAQTLNLSGGEVAQRLIELFLFDFTFTSESENREAKGYVKGVRKTKSSAESEVTDTLTLSTQYTDWAQLGFALNEFPKTQTNVILPLLKQATVPASAAFEIADAAITAGNLNYIKAYVNAFGTWGQPESLIHTADASTAPASASEVQVDTTNNKLVLHADRANAPISYSVPTNYTSIQAYGGAGTATKYGKISFLGKLHTPESTDNWVIYFPSLSRKSRPNIDLSEDVPTLSVEFAAETPSGWEQPFETFNLDTGVTA
ncbi:MAG: hypothetical protein AAFN08_10835 [Cyanobacteria bacterium J06559_3]